MSLLRRSLTSTLLIAALYIALDAIVVFLFNPIQFHFLPGISPYSSLIYLPFALRVFGTSLLGKEAIPGLFIGMLASSHYFWGVNNVEMLLALSFIGGFSTWLVFRAIAPLGVDAFYLEDRTQVPPLNTYLVAGLFVATLDAFLMVAVLEAFGKVHQASLTYASFVLGALSGLVVGWYLAQASLPLVNRLFRSDRAE